MLTGRVLAATGSRCYIRTTGRRFVETEAADGTVLPPAGSALSVAGFPETDGTRLRLTEAVFRTETNLVATQDVPQVLPFDRLYTRGNIRHGINTDFHGSLVTLRGRVSATVPDSETRQSFGLTDGNRLITVDCSGIRTSLPPDSAVVQVTGILLAEFEPMRPTIAFPVFRAFRLVPRRQTRT